jgi:hypothetical protein
MSKTNHQRGFKANRFHNGQQSGGFITFNGRGETVVSGRAVGACSTLASENSRSVARDRAGAKKYVRSRTRFHEDAALKKLVRELDETQ